MQARAQGMTAELSARERQILVLAAQGLTDQAIATRLGISLATVGTYWGRVRIKFGPLNRTELVAIYLREMADVALGELREENLRLAQQIESQVQSADALRSALDLFRAVFETSPDAMLAISESGDIQLANSQAEELFGYAPGGLVGLPVRDLVPEESRANHMQHMNAYRAHPVRKRMGEHAATLAQHREGYTFPIAAALNAAETPGGMLVLCVVRDLREEVSNDETAEREDLDVHAG